MTYRLHLIWTLLTFPTSLYALPHSPQREILSCMWLILFLVLSECLSSWRFWGDSAVRLSNTAGSWGYVSREIACLLQQAHSVFWDSPALLPVHLAAEEQHMANQKLDSSTRSIEDAAQPLSPARVLRHLPLPSTKSTHQFLQLSFCESRSKT